MLNQGISRFPFSCMSLERVFERIRCWFSVGCVDAKFLVLIFAAGFFVRFVPEVLAFPLPIGFDTVHYAVVMQSGVVWANWGAFFTSSWLLYALTVPFYSVSGVDAFFLLKFAAPALYGLNAAGVYWFGRKLLRWDVKLCLIAVGLFVFQLAALRISWDLLRNTLGMGLLLFALPLITRVGSKRGFVGFMMLSLLTVFAHEYAAVTLVFVISGLLFWRKAKGRFDRNSVRLLLSSLPAIAVFAIGMYLRFFPIKFDSSVSNVISTGESSIGRSFFMVNYLAVHDLVHYYPTYGALVLDVVLLFAFLYLPYLVLVRKGYFRHSVLSLWLGLLLIGAFGCLVWPFYALDYWSRWMFMLVYPFTFYAANGMFKVFKSSMAVRSLFGGFSKVAVAIGIVLLALLGVVYLATPILIGSGVGVWAAPYVSAHFSSAPTVPYEDVEGVTDAMMWIDENMGEGSFVVLSHVLIPWGRLYLDDSHVRVHFWHDVDLAVGEGRSRGFTYAYFVWWNEPCGWYEGSVPECFVALKDFGRISVFACEGDNIGGN